MPFRNLSRQEERYCPHLRKPFGPEVEFFTFPLKNDELYFACRVCAWRLLELVCKRDAEKAEREQERN